VVSFASKNPEREAEMSRLFAVPFVVVLVAAPVHAQNEAALKDYFEGRTVVVKMDMPATADGVDVWPDARKAVDFSQYAARLKSDGIAIRSGEPIVVTKVRVKDKLIEFQLGGGGFGTFGDDTSTSVYIPPAEKTQREKDLEREIKGETDRDRKRRMQNELDDLRKDREREDARNQARKAQAEEEKKQRVAQQRLHGGSRFNIRYQNGVPSGLGPDGIMRALADYVDFRGSGAPAASPPAASPGDARLIAAEPGALRKGMTFAEVADALGQPEKMTDRMEGTLRVTAAVFTRNDQRIQAEFVEGVLVKYSISSR
jgi:hypothetical protein